MFLKENWFYFLVHFYWAILMVSVESKECNITSSVYRQIENEGFHRILRYGVEISLDFKWEGCVLCLEEIIPSNFFLNTDELFELARFGKVFTFINETVDIEKPQSLSPPHLVLVYSEVVKKQGVHTANMHLPFHLRYHMPKPGGGYHRAFLNAPNLYIHCTKSPPCDTRLLPCSHNTTNLCPFHQFYYKLNSSLHHIDVPIGNTDHKTVVNVITVLSTSLGCIYILLILFRHKKNCVIKTD